MTRRKIHNTAGDDKIYWRKEMAVEMLPSKQKVLVLFDRTTFTDLRTK